MLHILEGIRETNRSRLLREADGEGLTTLDNNNPFFNDSKGAITQLVSGSFSMTFDLMQYNTSTSTFKWGGKLGDLGWTYDLNNGIYITADGIVVSAELLESFYKIFTYLNTSFADGVRDKMTNKSF